MTSRFLVALLLAAAALPALAREIVLLRSEHTAAVLRANGGDYDRLILPWRGFFTRQGIKARELPAEKLASVRQPAVLILPSAVALSDEERQFIRARVAHGWSVLGTWAVGVRDAKGAWKGYDFLQELFGVEVITDIPREKKEFVLPYGETPMTHALGAGTRMYLYYSPEPLLAVRARNTAARIGDYTRDPTHPKAPLGAAAFEERDGARRAFLGFPETTWDAVRDDIDAMLAGTLDWLRRKPIVVKSAWPHPHQAALHVEMDTEDKFENSVRFAEQLERFGIRGTFYVLTSEALKHPAVMKRLASKHEIAYHAEVHDGFAKLDPKKQDERMRSMIQQLDSVLPQAKSAAKGFRAPLEEYDAETEKLLRKHGLRYHAASPDSKEVLPGFSSAEPGLSPEDALVILPRTWIDDVWMMKMALLEKSTAESVLLAHLRDTVAMRGFGLLSLHTQNFHAGSAMERALPQLLEAIRKGGNEVWVAPGEAIERWWRDREAVQFRTVEDKGSLRVRIKATRGPVTGLRLVLMPPSNAKAPRLEGNARLEKLDEHRWAIVLPELKQGESELRVSF